MPTASQIGILNAVKALETSGRRPTLEALMGELDATGKGWVHGQCRILIGQGWLRRDPKTRILSVVRMPWDVIIGRPFSDHPLVAFIHRHQIENDGASPTRRQMMRGMGMRSLGGISRIFQSLVDEGALRTTGSGNRRNTKGAVEVVLRDQEVS
jgi:SOS-response transcriptional repressor LexA